MDICRELHQAWCEASQTPLPFDHWRQHAWEEWLRYVMPAIKASEWPKTTPAELLRVSLAVRKRMTRSKPEIAIAMFKFRRVTGSPDECVEDWTHEKASLRPRPQYPEAKRDVLRATGRADAPEPQEPRLSGELLDNALKQLRASVGSRRNPEAK